MPTLVVVLFYGYTALAGRNYLLADIMTFFLFEDPRTNAYGILEYYDE